MLRRTPLFAAHQNLGARLVEFGGWEMPVQYSGIVQEHQAVRTAAGLFDISHMGEAMVAGAGALGYLNGVLTNDLRKLAVGQGQYTLMCNERGGVIDDLYVYRIEPESFLLIINASRAETDLAWLQSRLAGNPAAADTAIRDASPDLGAVALQGPASAQFIDRSFPQPVTAGTAVRRPSELKKNQIAGVELHGQRIWIARTGYTGEDGFELVAPAALIGAVWSTLLEHGRDHGLIPCGLGARDTLRTEMGYPLYGHELDESITPLEAGLGFFVALDKPVFNGRQALADQKARGLDRRAVAFRMTGRSAPPRPDYALWSPQDASAPIGRVTSGTQSPSLGVGIGLGLVRTAFAHAGTDLEVEIRGHRWPAVVASKPLYKKAS